MKFFLKFSEEEFPQDLQQQSALYLMLFSSITDLLLLCQETG